MVSDNFGINFIIPATCQINGEAGMTFKDMLMLPLSKDNPTATGQAICSFLNEAYRDGLYKDKSCRLGYEALVFRCPDHEIQENEIFDHIAWENINFGVMETSGNIKTFREFVHLWCRTCFLNQPRDFDSL